MRFENPFNAPVTQRLPKTSPRNPKANVCRPANFSPRRFPVLHYGETPHYPTLDNWTFRLAWSRR